MTDKDMLVNLYDLPDDNDPTKEMAKKGIYIKRALAHDTEEILDFIRTEFSSGWANEARKAMYNFPSACYIAVYQKKTVGFACYDSTALGYFGPLGVAKSMRGQGIGSALTMKCLLAMREKGYGYIIINAGPVDYYIKQLNAKVIGDHKGVYTNSIANEE